MHFRFEQSWFLLLLLVLPLIWFCQRRMKSPSLQFAPVRVFRDGLKSAGLYLILIQKTLFYTPVFTLLLWLAPSPVVTNRSPIFPRRKYVRLFADVVWLLVFGS